MSRRSSRMRRAAKATGWVRHIAGSKAPWHGRYRERVKGTFGAASGVRVLIKDGVALEHLGGGGSEERDTPMGSNLTVTETRGHVPNPIHHISTPLTDDRHHQKPTRQSGSVPLPAEEFGKGVNGVGSSGNRFPSIRLKRRRTRDNSG
jgi:hypothetical protein